MWQTRRVITQLVLGSALLAIQQPLLAADVFDWIDNKFYGGERQAREKQEKEERNRELAALNSCKQAIRGSIRAPSTLQWGSISDPSTSMIRGMVGPNMRRTEGGYVVSEITGSHSGGVFVVICYTDLSFRVTHLKDDSGR